MEFLTLFNLAVTFIFYFFALLNRFGLLLLVEQNKKKICGKKLKMFHFHIKGKAKKLKINSLNKKFIARIFSPGL